MSLHWTKVIFHQRDLWFFIYVKKLDEFMEMHTECLSGHALDKGKDEISNKESDTVLMEEAKSGAQIESEGKNFDVENMKETCASSCNNAAATNYPFTQENDIVANCSVPEFNPPISDHPCVNPKFDGYSDHQNLNYNELLKQYNELELRKEKIVEQLWQANYWNYQTPVQCPTSQQQQVSVSSGAELGPNTSCPWCTCQCLTTALSSISNCPMASALSVGYSCCPQQFLCCSGSQVQQEAGDAHCSTNGGKCSMVTSFSENSINHLVQGDNRVVETGAMPVEFARNPVKADLTRAFNLHEEKKNGEDDVSGKDLSSTSQKTDLTSVINAWYWAGYHTGRYLLEQEQSDKLNNNTGGEKQLIVSKEKGGSS